MENKEDGCIICFDEKKVIHAKCHVCTGIIIHRKCLDIIIFKYGGKCPKCRGKLVKEVSVIGKNIMFPNFALRVQIHNGIFIHNNGGPRFVLIRKLFLIISLWMFFLYSLKIISVCFSFLIEIKDITFYNKTPDPVDKIVNYILYSWILLFLTFFLN